MRRITITVEDTVTDEEALELLLQVIKEGKVSIGAKDKLHYSWLTTWSNGEFVYTKPKYKTDNDRFYIGFNKNYINGNN